MIILVHAIIALLLSFLLLQRISFELDPVNIISKLKDLDSVIVNSELEPVKIVNVIIKQC